MLLYKKLLLMTFGTTLVLPNLELRNSEATITVTMLTAMPLIESLLKAQILRDEGRS